MNRLLTLCLIFVISIPCIAVPKKADKMRTVFIKKDKKGIEWVCIRLTPPQIKSAKTRARIKRRGVIRVPLHARQIALLIELLGKNFKLRKVRSIILLIPAKRFHKRRGFDRYIVRRKSAFIQNKLTKNGSLELGEEQKNFRGGRRRKG